MCLNPYLPASWTITVALILEIGHITDHPVIDLWQRQSFFWGTLNGAGNEIRVGLVTPRVPPRGFAFAQRSSYIERRASQAWVHRAHGCWGAGWMLQFPRHTTDDSRSASRDVLWFHLDVGQRKYPTNLVSAKEILRARQWPGTRARPALRLKIRINLMSV